MKRILLILAMLACPLVARSQNTTVTATVTDPVGTAYTFATGYAALVCPGNQQPTYNGYTVPRTFAITGFDGTGTFTQTLYDTSVIVPTGCGYQWHIVWSDGVTAFITATITTVTGASVNLSATISSYSVSLPLAAGNAHNLTGPGSISGTLSGAPTFTGLHTFNAGITSAGPNTFNGGGTTAGAWTHAGAHTFSVVPIFNIGINVLEGAASGTGVGTDQCFGNSATHTLQCSYNNGTAGSVPLLNLAQTWTATQTTQTILPSAAASYNLGSIALPWGAFFVGPGANQTSNLQSLATANRNVSFPDVTGTVELVIGGASTALSTSALGGAGCETTITVASASVTTASRIVWNFATDPSAVAGYGASPIDAVHLLVWPTTGNVNFKQCSSVAVTPGAISILWNAFNPQ